jgi:hypothetical protein
MWPVDTDRSRRRRRDYGGHFQVAMQDLQEPMIFAFYIRACSGV